jgi:hypothetical protein
MRIENLKSKISNQWAGVAADVIWEDCDLPMHEVYFETSREFANDLLCNPHAFLIACSIPAMHYGERRISIDAEVCPELREGLMVAMGWLSHWFHPERSEIVIETKPSSSMRSPRTSERAGLFFSGGIDSFASLCSNHRDFPSKHPWRIKDGILVYGLELDESVPFECVVTSLSSVAENIGITLIPIYTNVYLHYRDEDAADDFRFWNDKFMGAALASVAHALAERLTVVSIASARHLRDQVPHGSHPLVDTNYSSSDLRIRHDGVTLSRLARTKLVADRGELLENIRVCNQYKLYRPGRLNCGGCEKCVRTMLALLVLGALDKTGAFPDDDVSEELAWSAIKVNDELLPLYEELIMPLKKKGRHDLVHILQKKIIQYRNSKRKYYWKNVAKRIDSSYLGGNFKKIKRLIQSSQT